MTSLFSSLLGKLTGKPQQPDRSSATLPTNAPSDSASGPDESFDPYDIKDERARKKVKDRIEESHKKATNRRWMFELTWLRNVLYYLAIQWVRVDWPGREVRNLSLPGNFPRAITNTFGKVNSDLMSAITQGEVPLTPRPSTDNPDDVATAEVGERLREVIDEEIGTKSIKRDLGFWLVLTGNAFVLPYYDYNPMYGTKDVSQYKCTACGAQTFDPTKPCSCGGPPLPPPQLDPTQPAPQPQPPYVQTGVVPLPIGKLCNDVLSPYEIYWDNTIRLATGQQRWFQRPHRYDVMDAKALWPDYKDKIAEDMSDPMKVSRNYLIAIAYAGSYLSGVTGSGEASARENSKKQVTAWEHYEMPCAEYPQGLRAVQMGDLILELGPLPTEWGAGQTKGQKFLPLVHFYGEVSGGAWGKPRANDLCSIQARRNIIASNLQLTAQRTGSPKLLDPVGSGLQAVTGEAGQVVRYKPIVFGGTTAAEPHYLEAALGNVQPLVLMLKQLDDEMEQIAGTRFVQGGDVPSGVSAASALAYLGEKATQSIAPMKEVWVESWRTVYRYDIELARQHWTDERILAILGQNKQWQFQKFKSADLKGAVDMRIDYDAMFPKSQATERANIMALAQIGAIQPAMDPEQRYAVLEVFGATSLKESIDRARQQAMREWQNFLNDSTYQPVLLPMVQDAAAHLMQHKLDATSQEFEDLYRTNQQRADVWIAHIQATQTEILVQSMPMPGAGGPTPPSPSDGAAGPHAGPHPGHVAGAQAGSQAGPAKGNLLNAAPIRKGEAAAQEPGSVPGA